MLFRFLLEFKFLQGLYEYSNLWHLVQLHNEAFGLAACGLVFGYMPTQVYTIPQLIQPTGILESVNALTNSVIPTLFLVYSAWFSNKVSASLI